MAEWLTVSNIVAVASIVLQLAAAYYAYRLIRTTGVFRAWALVVLALCLQVLRRIISFITVAGSGTEILQMFDLFIMLAISLFLLLGMYELSKKFEKILKK